MTDIKYPQKRKTITSEVNLLKAFQNLRSNHSLYDVSLYGSSTNSRERNPVRAHKVVLAAYSSIFKEMLSEQSSHSEPFIYLKGVSYDLISNILDFMYNGEVSVLQSELANFMEVAEDLKIA